MSQRSPRLVAPELTKALSHPTRSHLLSILFERTASPKEMAQELDCSIRHVTYHLGVLEDLGCVELVRAEPAVGGRVVQHFYKAVKRAWLDRESWDQLDAGDQQGITATLMEMISADIQEAMTGGTLNDPPTNHISRTPMTVDPAGWDEVTDLLSSTLDELLAIQTRVANRLTPDAATMPMRVEIIHFRSPDREPRAAS